MKNIVWIAGCLMLTTNFLRAEMPGIVSSEQIFEDPPFKSCHASTIVETEKGLVSAWFGGTHESHPDVGIWLSRYVDGKWTAPVEAANGDQPTTDGSSSSVTRYASWNPVLYQPKGKPLMLFYKVGLTPSKWWGEFTESSDAGQTWSKAKRLPPGFLGPIKNKPVMLPDGSLLCPSSTERDKDDKNQSGPPWQLQFERTSDWGKTWTKSAPRDANDISAIQPSILFLGGEKLMALGRTRGKGKVFQVVSDDLGKTWGPLELTSLPNPNSGTDAVTLKDGRHLIVYNPVEKGRSPLSLAISSDAKKWQAALEFENEPGMEFSYPAIIQTRDGLVHVVYTWKRSGVKHVVVDPAKLQPRDFAAQ